MWYIAAFHVTFQVSVVPESIRASHCLYCRDDPSAHWTIMLNSKLPACAPVLDNWHYLLSVLRFVQVCRGPLFQKPSLDTEFGVREKAWMHRHRAGQSDPCGSHPEIARLSFPTFEALACCVGSDQVRGSWHSSSGLAKDFKFGHSSRHPRVYDIGLVA